MMAVDVRRLSETEVHRIGIRRARLIAERRIDAALLAAASLDVEGERRWFALRVGNRSEIDVRDRLTDSRVDAVVPVKRVPVKRRFGGASRKFVHRPVLSGLVFVNLVPSHHAFAGLLRVKGVDALVGADGRPYPIGEQEMKGFMDLAQAGAFNERHTPGGLKVGSRVKINVGPYAEFEGVLEGYARGRAARVMTWLFGCEMTVDVKVAHLEKLE